MKPKAVVDYNFGKASIDLSDQLASYGTALRRSLKWYRKIAIELLLGTAVVNARFLYNLVTSKNIKVNKFREQIVLELLKSENKVSDSNIALGENTAEPTSSTKKKPMASHKFVKKNLEVPELVENIVGAATNERRMEKFPDLKYQK